MNAEDHKNPSSDWIKFATAWLVSWAVTTYLSALARTGFTASEQGLIGAVFATADAVPPLAKLAFGFTLGALLLAVRHAPVPNTVRGFALTVGSVLVFACATLFFPTHYYANFSFDEFWPLHAIAAALGGLILLRAPSA